MTQAIDIVQPDPNAHRIYRVQHGGETHEPVAYADVAALVAALVQKHGAPPTPSIVEITPAQAQPAPRAQPAAAPAPAQPAPQASALAAPQGRGVGNIDAAGKARSEADLAAAKAAGFAPAATVYERGTRVVDVGVENARTFRLEYEQKPLVQDACEALRTQIAAEHRAAVQIARSQVFMNSEGALVIGEGTARKRLLVEERAFKQLCGRLGLPAGAGPYLSACWPDLRARNINNWQQRAKEADAVGYANAQAKGETFEPDTLMFRTRDHKESNGRVAFAIVSDGYGEFDIDRLAQAVEDAMPEGARCAITYDGRRAKIEVLFHSTVQPEDYVCGEFFRAAIIVRTDDTGGGSCKGWSAIEQNLCTNLIITSRNAKPVFQVQHRHSREEMAARIKAGLRKAEENLAHFLKQWGYARKDDLVAQAKARGELYEGMPMRDMLAALVNGTIERELVPVLGRRDVVVPQLMRAWDADRSGDGPSAGTVTRAGLVNAFTRWAHEDCPDRFFTHTVEAAASGLLWPGTDRARVPPAIPAIPAIPLALTGRAA